MSITKIAQITALLITSPVWAGVSYLKCELQVTYHRPTYQNTVWTHVENSYSKYFRIDSDAKMVSLFDDRKDVYKPICHAGNSFCENHWSASSISVDGTKHADDPLPPHLDFRRSVSLSDHLSKAHLTIADFGESPNGRANMTWDYDGSCVPSDQPIARIGRGAGAVMPNPTNPNYERAKGPALPVSDTERDQVLASYNGNTLWGFSGGGSWLHMWFFDKGLAYTSDGYDMSSETTTRQWYVGKDSTGYRICSAPIPAEGLIGCYPLPPRKVGEQWVQHDMDGDAQFTLLPGRQ